MGEVGESKGAEMFEVVDGEAIRTGSSGAAA